MMSSLLQLRVLLGILLLSSCSIAETAFPDLENVESGKEVYVDNSGHDYPGCGPQDNPCKTIRYAVNRTEPNSKVLINGLGGPYTGESGDTYIEIRHSLWLSSRTSQRVTIQCNNTSYKLFQVIGKSNSVNCLTLSNIAIHGCQDAGFGATGVISLENAQLKLNNSEFVQNGLLVYHPQTSAANETCGSIEVYAKDCSFKSNFATQPFIPGISLLGCRSITLQVEDSDFHSSPIAVKSAKDTKVRFIRAGFYGSGIKGSSVRITASSGSNGISFNRCNFTDHLASKSSPAAIFLESVPNGTSTVSFTETRFSRNQRQSTSGGAFSVVSRFRKPVRLDVRLDGCLFEENSAMDVGGAIHIAYVKLVHISGCQFRNNTGSNGGAISLLETENVTIANSEFENNSAVAKPDSKTMAVGGAIFVEKGDLQVTGGNFTGNTAVYSGSAIFATRCSRVLLTSSRFVNTQNASSYVSPQNQMLFISTVDSASENATVWMVKNSLLVRGQHDQNVMFISGKIHERNNSLTCPESHTSDHSVLQPNYRPRYFEFMQLGAWCEACPRGKYGLATTVDLTSHNPSSEKSCKSCPLNAICEYGQIRTLPNHWGLVLNDSVEMFLCPRGQCCDSLDSYNDFHACKEHRNGILCGDCESGNEKSFHLGSARCTPSQSCWERGAVAGFTVLFFLVFFALLGLKYNLLKLPQPANNDDTETLLPGNGEVVSNRDELIDASNTDSSHPDGTNTPGDASVHLPAYWFSVVVFYQLTSIVYPRFSFSVETIDTIIWVIIEMFNLLPPLSAINICTSKLFPLSFNSARFLFFRIYFWGLLILPCIVIATVYAFVRCFSGPNWRQKRDGIRDWFGAYLIFFFLYSNVPLMRSGLEAVTCIRIHNTSFVFGGDGTIECYQTGQIVIVVYLIVCVVPLFLFLENGVRLLRGSLISWNAFVACCAFPLLGCIRLMCARLFSTCRPSDSDIYPNSDQGQVPSPRSDESRVFHAVVTRPYRNFLVLRVNGLTVLLLRSFVIVLFGSVLSPWPFIQSVVLAVSCALFLTCHVLTKWFTSDRLNQLESLHLILLTTFAVLSVYSSVLYVLGQTGNDGNVRLIQDICDWFCRVVLLAYLFCWIVVISYRATKTCTKNRRQRETEE